MTFVDQIFDGDAVETNMVLLDEGEHFAHGFALRAVRWGSGRLAQTLQRLADHLLSALKLAGVKLSLMIFSCSGVS